MKGDIVIKSQNIYTGCDEGLISGFIVIKDGLIVQIGSGSYAEYCDENTDILSCEHNMVMPGFHDSHVHFDWGIMQRQGVNLWQARSQDEAARMVADFAKHTDQEIIYGYDWFQKNWEIDALPTKESLDRYLPERPVVLYQFECHGLWLNSAAILYFNIQGDDLVLEGGKIFVDSNHNPTGYLQESATFPLYDKGLIPNREEKKYYEDLLTYFASLGITAISHIQLADTINYQLLRDMEKNNELNIRFGFSVPLAFGVNGSEKFKKYASDNLYFLGFKTFMDGTVLGFTADLIKPYANNPTTTNSNPVDTESIRKEFLSIDEKGYRVRFHAIGDLAVKKTLDFCEEAIEINGKRDSRHSIAHIELIEEEDIKRFRALGVVADIHPPHITLDANRYEHILYPTYIGEEQYKCFNFKSLLDAGASYAMGSDYPVTTPNPFLGIYRGMTRRFDDDQPKEGWISEQKLTLHELLQGYTKGSAYHDFMEEKIGTLEVGKYADIVVVDQNLFECEPLEIKHMKVNTTLFNGKVIYQRDVESR